MATERQKAYRFSRGCGRLYLVVITLRGLDKRTARQCRKNRNYNAAMAFRAQRCIVG